MQGANEVIANLEAQLWAKMQAVMAAASKDLSK